jgi:predicted RNA methylase
MSLNSDEGSSESIGHCSVCGHLTELVALLGAVEMYCFECSADMATASLLITEIDAATLAGRDAKELVAECTEISNRILERAQAPEFGF